LIALVADKQSGKSTIANYIANQYGYQCMSFATPLKQAVQAIFGFSYEQVYGDDKEILDSFWQISSRQVMQWVGNELFRERFGQLAPSIGDQIWVRALERRLEGAEKVVIDDLRYPNEYAMIKAHGGVIIRVSRGRSTDDLADTHPSEVISRSICADFVLTNDGSFTELYHKIDDLMLTLGDRENKT